ncbi:GNAT family N-acetyltransferase [Hirschia maritima]|uniref:GNAT family N-acetyltransferase n=1 Tax=Hirschia maritima TaxID=1121961 RepID=UPI00037FF844|nr:GNAT family N-acetyltransferase [Hirschia maritima]
MDLNIREAQLEDIDWIVDLNQANIPAVGSLTRDEYEALEKQCHGVLVVEDETGERCGFIMLIAKGRDYSSPNYRWFEENFDSFLYVDRIAVSEAGRGKGVGLALYSEALDMAEAQGAEKLVAEVNVKPMNEVSMNFHKRLGFEEVAQLTHEDQGKTVSMLVRSTLNPEKQT